MPNPANKDDTGKETVWAVEGMAPNALYRLGWRPNTANVGDTITVEGWLARDGSHLINMGSATMGGRAAPASWTRCCEWG